MTEDRLGGIERRLRALEDERDISRLITSYGPLVDAGDADAVAGLWASHGVYDVEDWIMRGRDEVRAMVNSDAHQGLIARGCCHFFGPAVITVEEDDAVAVCESVLLLRRDTGGYQVLRAGVHHFHLRRIGGQWQIVTRTARTLNGDPEARALLSAGVGGRVRLAADSAPSKPSQATSADR